MLKFKNQNGITKYILLDGDSQPRELTEELRKFLIEKGIIFVEENNETCLEIHGISQNDLKYLKENINEL